jgi:hypothetical protein
MKTNFIISGTFVPKTIIVRSLSSMRKLPNMDAFIERRSLGKMIELAVARLSGSPSRKRGKELIGLLKRYLHGVLGKLSYSKVKLIAYFCFFLYRLHRDNGRKGLVLYLKSCHVLTMQSIGNYRIRDSTLLKQRVRRRRSGLPLVIPVLQARLIMKRDTATIRL